MPTVSAFADRCEQPSTTTGPGNIVLLPHLTGLRDLSEAYGVNVPLPYAIEGLDADGELTGEWEVGRGHLNSSGELVRDLVYVSSTGSGLVSFNSTVLRVFVTASAAAMNEWLDNNILNDTQHGTRGGGDLHATFSSVSAGFVPASGGGTTNFLRADGAWAPAGDLSGPASATDNAVVRFDGTTGKLVKNSGVTIDNSGNMVVAGNLTVQGTTTTINSTVVDIVDRVIHVNHSTGANDPVPSLISGISVHRGAVAGVARDHPGWFWDETNSQWRAAMNTAGDDSTVGADIKVRMGALDAHEASKIDLPSGFADILTLSVGGVSRHQFRSFGGHLQTMTDDGTNTRALIASAVLLLNSSNRAALWTMADSGGTKHAAFFHDGTPATHSITLTVGTGGGNAYENSAVWTAYSSGTFVINELGRDLDFRVEGDTDPNLITADAGLEVVGIGHAGVSGTKLHVAGVFGQTEIAAPSVSGSGLSRIYVDSTTHRARISTNGGAYSNLLIAGDIGTSVGDVTGNGAAPISAPPYTYYRIPYWTTTKNIESDANFTIGISSGDEQYITVGDPDFSTAYASLNRYPGTDPGTYIAQVDLGSDDTQGYSAVKIAASPSFTYLTQYGSAYGTTIMGTTLNSAFAIEADGAERFFLHTASGKPIIMGAGTTEVVRIINSGTGFVFNEAGADIDARFEGDTDPNLLVLDAGLDRVAIGGAPISTYKFLVTGNASEVRSGTQNTSTTGLAYVQVAGSDNSIAMVGYGISAAGTLWGKAVADSVWIGSSVASRFFIQQGTAGSELLFGVATSELLKLTDTGTGLVWNEGHLDIDARFESDVNPNLLYLDAGLSIGGVAGEGGVGVGAVPTQRFYVEGADTGTIFSLIKNTSSSGAAGIGAHNNNANVGAFLRAYGSASAATLAGFTMTNAVSFNAEGALVTGMVINVATDTPMVFGQNNLERARYAPNIFVFNENGADYDFRAEGDTDQNLFVLDAGLDVAGIGTAGVSGYKLAVHSGASTTLLGIQNNLSTGVAAFHILGSGGASTNVVTAFAYNGSAAGTTFGIANANLGGIYASGSSMSGFVVGTFTADPLYLGTNNTERISISSAGVIVVNEGGADADVRFEGDNDANLLTADAGLDRIGIGVALGAHTAKLQVTAGSLASTVNALAVTGSLSSTAATQRGVTLFITGAGSGSNTVEGLIAGLSTNGYSGSGTSVGANLYNESIGTGADPFSNEAANYAVRGQVYGASATGSNVAFGAKAISALRNYGFLSTQFTDSQTNGYNVGFASYAKNAATGGVRVGAFFSLGTSALPPVPTMTSSALITDNGDTTDPIILARDNGVIVLTVADGGLLTQDGGAIFNEAGADVDFRVEGDTLTHLLFADAGLDRVGINQSSPQYRLHVVNDAAVQSTTSATALLDVYNSSTGNAGVRVINTTSAAGIKYLSFLGTTSSLLDIQLVGSGAGAGTFLGNSRDGSAEIYARPDGGSLLIGTNTAHALRLGTFDVERISISSAGVIVFNETGADADVRFESDTDANLLYLDSGALTGTGAVGIGTNAPIRDLHVLRTVAAAGVTVQTENTAADGAAQFIAQEPNVQLASVAYGATFAGTTFGLTNAGKAGLLASGTSLTGLLIGTLTSDAITFGTNNTSAMTIDTSQRTILPQANSLGIGGTPGEYLDIIAIGSGSRGGRVTNSTTNGSSKWELSAATGVNAIFWAFGTGSVGISNFGTVNDGQVLLLGSGAGLTGMKIGVSTSDPVRIGTNDVERVVFNATSGVVFNDGGNDYDFTVESDTLTHAFFIDGGTGAVGIGTATPVVTSGFGSLSINGADGGAISFLNSDVADATVYSDAAGDGLGLLTLAALDIMLGTNNAARVIIDGTTGFVGINVAASGDQKSWLHVNGSFGANVTSVSADTTLNETHFAVDFNASGGNKVATLPPAASCTGRVYLITKTDSSANTVTIDGDGAETINGATTLVLTTQYATATVQSNGSGWYVR